MKKKEEDNQLSLIIKSSNPSKLGQPTYWISPSSNSSSYDQDTEYFIINNNTESHSLASTPTQS